MADPLWWYRSGRFVGHVRGDYFFDVNGRCAGYFPNVLLFDLDGNAVGDRSDEDTGIRTVRFAGTP